MEFSKLDGKRIAVILQGAQVNVVRGHAHFEVDEDLGNCLRIDLSGTPGNPQLLFPESGTPYEFEPDRQFGCDYAVTVHLEFANSGAPASRADE